MRLLERVKTVIRADAHGVVDSLEDDELLLKQAVRDMEVALADRRRKQQRLATEQTHLETRLERLTPEIEASDREVESALSANEPELARYAARKYLGGRREAQALAHRSQDVRQEMALLEQRIATEEKELQALASEVALRLARDGQPAGGGGPSRFVADEEVDLELLRRRGAGGAA